MLALPIFPGRLQPSIVSRNELNCRVRNGNGWTLALISTNCHPEHSGKQTNYKVFPASCQALFEDLEPEASSRSLPILNPQRLIFGAPSGTRTRDPLIKSQLLYQLS